MTLCDYSFPLFGWLVLFPTPDALQTPRVLPIDWLFVHLNALFVWRIMIDGLWGWWAWCVPDLLSPLASVWGIWLGQRSEWDQGYFWGCFGHAGCCVWELAPAAKVTWEFKPLSWNLESNLGWRLRSRVWRKSTTSSIVGAALWNQSRFFSLALDVKFGSHSFLMALSVWSVLHFITRAAVENCSGLWFDDYRILCVCTNAQSFLNRSCMHQGSQYCL